LTAFLCPFVLWVYITSYPKGAFHIFISHFILLSEACLHRDVFLSLEKFYWSFDMSSANYSTSTSAFAHAPSAFYQFPYGTVYSAHHHVTIRGTTHFINNLHAAGVPGALTYRGTVYFPQSGPSSTSRHRLPAQELKDGHSTGVFEYQPEQRQMDSRSVSEYETASDSDDQSV
ncbi:hypothetical protein EDD85DRAFT_351557, partial [Armillaria nabsnona]